MVFHMSIIVVIAFLACLLHFSLSETQVNNPHCHDPSSTSNDENQDGNYLLYSQYYDLLYQDKDYEKEVDYLHGLIQTYGHAVQSVMELGCGTGKHAIGLASKGYRRVHGIDLSLGMVQKAKERLNSSTLMESKVSFEIGDVRTYQTMERFDVILSLFHVVSYQTSINDLDNIFKTASNHMVEGGIFIFDVWYGPAVLNLGAQARVKEMENNQIKVIRFAQPEHHPNENTIDVNYNVLIQDKVSGSWEQIKEKHPMRYLFMPELRTLMKYHGFQFVRAEQWITGAEPSEETWGVTFICKCSDKQ